MLKAKAKSMANAMQRPSTAVLRIFDVGVEKRLEPEGFLVFGFKSHSARF